MSQPRVLYVGCAPQQYSSTFDTHLSGTVAGRHSLLNGMLRGLGTSPLESQTGDAVCLEHCEQGTTTKNGILYHCGTRIEDFVAQRQGGPKYDYIAFDVAVMKDLEDNEAKKRLVADLLGVLEWSGQMFVPLGGESYTLAGNMAVDRMDTQNVVLDGGVPVFRDIFPGFLALGARYADAELHEFRKAAATFSANELAGEFTACAVSAHEIPGPGRPTPFVSIQMRLDGGGRAAGGKGAKWALIAAVAALGMGAAAVPRG